MERIGHWNWRWLLGGRASAGWGSGNQTDARNPAVYVFKNGVDVMEIYLWAFVGAVATSVALHVGFKQYKRWHTRRAVRRYFGRWD